MAAAAQVFGQETKKVIAFGGTGKAVGLIYLKIGRLLGERSNILICDFPASSDPNSPDGRLDLDLAAEGVGEQFRVNTLPDSWVAAPNTLVEHLNLRADVADALFTDKQQRTPPNEGLNQEPQLGGTISRLKIQTDGEQIRAKAVSPGQDEIYLVAGLGGGTGTGVTPNLARFLRRAAINCRLHGVFLMPWEDIGDNEVGNAGQRRNAASLLKYLHEHHEELFDSTLILGGFPGLELLPVADTVHRPPVHPTLILAALYIHMWHAWGGGAQLASRLNRLETLQTGITLGEITGRDGNLHEMLVHSAAVYRLLREIIDQYPDECLALFSLYPLSAPLAWRMTQSLLKKYCRVAGLSYPVGWVRMREALNHLAEQELARRRWIEELAADRRVFRFNREVVEDQSQALHQQARGIVVKDDRYKKFRIQDPQAALSETCAFLYDVVNSSTLKCTHLRRSAAGAPAPPVNRATRVWLPLPFPGKNSRTEFTALRPADLEALAAHYGVPTEDLVSPEPLGVRQVFLWRLTEDLRNGRGRSLEHFALLVEGLLYGLLWPDTYDLSQLGLEFERREDRFLTLLKFRSAAGAPETVAGSFSPETLVCPAANWSERNTLENRVQDLRFTTGPRARALLRAFLAEFPAPEMPWHKALEWLVREFQSNHQEPVANQRNVGPLYLRAAPTGEVRTVFFPQFRPGWLGQLVRCFSQASYERRGSCLQLCYQHIRVGQLARPLQTADPKIHGLGCVTLEEENLDDLPANTALSPQAKRVYLEAVTPVTNNYSDEIQADSNRFLIPDSLRCAFYLWGRAAVQELVGGRLNQVYGHAAMQAGLHPQPHQSPDGGTPGLKGDRTATLFYVSRTSDQRLAYHVEQFGGRQIGELSGLGYALWRVFCGARWDELTKTATDRGVCCLVESDGWLGAPQGLHLRPPDATTEIMKWSTLLAEVARMPEGLFRTAAEVYIQKFGLPGTEPKKRAETRIISILNEQWCQLA